MKSFVAVKITSWYIHIKLTLIFWHLYYLDTLKMFMMAITRRVNYGWLQIYPRLRAPRQSADDCCSLNLLSFTFPWPKHFRISCYPVSVNKVATLSHRVVKWGSEGDIQPALNNTCWRNKYIRKILFLKDLIINIREQWKQSPTSATNPLNFSGCQCNAIPIQLDHLKSLVVKPKTALCLRR